MRVNPWTPRFPLLPPLTEHCVTLSALFYRPAPTSSCISSFSASESTCYRWDNLSSVHFGNRWNSLVYVCEMLHDKETLCCLSPYFMQCVFLQVDYIWKRNSFDALNRKMLSTSFHSLYLAAFPVIFWLSFWNCEKSMFISLFTLSCVTIDNLTYWPFPTHIWARRAFPAHVSITAAIQSNIHRSH